MNKNAAQKKNEGSVPADCISDGSHEKLTELTFVILRDFSTFQTPHWRISPSFVRQTVSMQSFTVCSSRLSFLFLSSFTHFFSQISRTLRSPIYANCFSCKRRLFSLVHSVLWLPAFSFKKMKTAEQRFSKKKKASAKGVCFLCHAVSGVVDQLGLLVPNPSHLTGTERWERVFFLLGIR